MYNTYVQEFIAKYVHTEVYHATIMEYAMRCYSSIVILWALNKNIKHKTGAIIGFSTLKFWIVDQGVVCTY